MKNIEEKILLTTTENIPDTKYKIIGIVACSKISYKKALKKLQIKAKKMNTDAIVSIKTKT